MNKHHILFFITFIFEITKRFGFTVDNIFYLVLSINSSIGTYLNMNIAWFQWFRFFYTKYSNFKIRIKLLVIKWSIYLYFSYSISISSFSNSFFILFSLYILIDSIVLNLCVARFSSYALERRGCWIVCDWFCCNIVWVLFMGSYDPYEFLTRPLKILLAEPFADKASSS